MTTSLFRQTLHGRANLHTSNTGLPPMTSPVTYLFVVFPASYALIDSACSSMDLEDMREVAAGCEAHKRR